MTTDKEAKYNEYIDYKETFSQPDNIVEIENKVGLLLQITDFDFEWRFRARFSFELLLLTIDVPKCKSMFIRLLEHIKQYAPDLSYEYWTLYDNLPILIEKKESLPFVYFGERYAPEFQEEYFRRNGVF